MSVLLESLLDDERRVKCRANDAAMAMGRPIIVSQPAIGPVRRTSSLHHHAAPPRSEPSNPVLVATDELW